MGNLNTQIYNDAFQSELANIWNQTPFGDEIEDLSLKRATAIFLKDTPSSINQRRDLLYSYLKPAFSVEDSEDLLNKLKFKLPTRNSLYKRAVKNICSLYGEPERQISEQLEDRYKNLGFNNIQKSMYWNAKVSGESAIRPYIKDNQLYFYTYTSDNYRYKTNELGDIIEFWVAYTVSKSTSKRIVRPEDISPDYANRYQVWDAESVKILDENLQIIDEDINPYGVIPFEVLRIGNNTDYNDRGGSLWSLVELQLIANQIDLLVDENLIYGTLGIWLGINLETEQRSVKLGAGRIVLAKHRDSETMPPTLEYITANGQYLDLRQAKDSIIKEELKNLGLPSSILSDSNDLSGKAMRLDRMELEEIREEDRPILQAYENSLNNLVKIVTDTDGVPYPSEDFNINFPTQTTYDKTDLEFLDMLLSKGFISIAEYGRRIGMSGTDEQIIDIINNNREVNGLTSNQRSQDSQTSNELVTGSENPERAEQGTNGNDNGNL